MFVLTVENKVERTIGNLMDSGASFYYLTDGTVVVWDRKTGEVSTLHEEPRRRVERRTDQVVVA